MSAIWSGITGFLESLSIKQLLALGIFLVIAGFLKDMAKGVVSTILSIIAIFAALYFFAPEMYETAILWVKNLLIR